MMTSVFQIDTYVNQTMRLYDREVDGKTRQNLLQAATTS